MVQCTADSDCSGSDVCFGGFCAQSDGSRLVGVPFGVCCLYSPDGSCGSCQSEASPSDWCGQSQANCDGSCGFWCLENAASSSSGGLPTCTSANCNVCLDPSNGDCHAGGGHDTHSECVAHSNHVWCGSVCTGIDGTYNTACPSVTGWDASIDTSLYADWATCTVLVDTNGDTCQSYCAAQGYTCVAAQDNSDGCTLVRVL